MKEKSKETDAAGTPEESSIPVSRASPGSRSCAKNPLVHIACLVFLILIVYSNTLNAPFQWDENLYLATNPIVKGMQYFASPSDAKGFQYYDFLMLRYVGFLTFALNYKINGLSVTGYHIVNTAIHVTNSILVYLVVLLTFRTPYFRDQGTGTRNQGTETSDQIPRTGNPVPDTWSPVPDPRFPVPGPWPLDPKLVAFFSAAIFAVHPLQTEAVTYVFQRFASLVAFFYLLSLAAFIKARLRAVNSERVSGESKTKKHSLTILTWFFLSLFSAVCAMKTKENAFTLPLIITLYEFCFFSRSSSPLTIYHSRFLYLIPILLTLTIVPLTLMGVSGRHQLDPGTYGAGVFSRGEYFFTQFRVIVTYLRLLFFPVDQNVDYDYPVFKSFSDPQVILSFVFLSLLFGLGVCMVIRTRDNTKENDSGQAGMTKKVGLAAFRGDNDSRKFFTFRGPRHSGLSGIGSLFTSHYARPLRLIGFGILWFFITLSTESSIIPIPMLINEYRAYMPSVGVIICVVTGAFWVFSHFTSQVSRPLIVLLVLIIGILAIATYKRNEVWGDNIRLWEDTAEKSPGKAEVRLNLGLAYQKHNMRDKALDQYLDAIKLKPDLVQVHYNLGGIYEDLNMSDKAIEQYQIAIKLKPDYAATYNNLGLVYQNLNMPDKAIEQYQIAIKLKPDYAAAHNNLGGVYQNLNMPDKAIEQYQIAIKIKPIAEAHFNIGLLYFRMGQTESARTELTAGLKIKPDNQKAQQLLREISR